MALRFDIKTMSFEGYSIKKVREMHQSNGFNFGKLTEVELEVIHCNKCKRDCKTACDTSGTALYAKCEKCDMEYFQKK